MEPPDIRTREPVGQQPMVDPTKCYFCGETRTARCAACRVPLCDDHQHEIHRNEFFCEAMATMCIECAIHIRNC